MEAVMAGIRVATYTHIRQLWLDTEQSTQQRIQIPQWGVHCPHHLQTLGFLTLTRLQAMLAMTNQEAEYTIQFAAQEPPIHRHLSVRVGPTHLICRIIPLHYSTQDLPNTTIPINTNRTTINILLTIILNINNSKARYKGTIRDNQTCQATAD